MHERMRVYKLSEVTDDPRFEGFGSDGTFPNALPVNRKTRDWRPKRLAPAWVPVQVVGRVRKCHDYPCVGGRPAFSQRAVDALRDFLEPNGELLPLKARAGSYFAYNVTTVVDVLDWRRSKITWNPKPISAMFIDRYEFLAAKLEGLSIFKILEDTVGVYVTEAFVRRALDQSLQGMDFRLVWPLPPGVSWRKLSKAAWERRARMFKGNTVVLRFGLVGSKPTAAERKRIEDLEDQLDALFSGTGDTTSPATGSVEGFDNGAPRECRVFLSCPDADSLVKFLRPWLREVDWAGSLGVVKRYGHYLDADAREEAVSLSRT